MVYGKKEINLYEEMGFVLTINPCIVLVNNDLLLFEKIDGKKLFPFFKTKFINVPKRM